MNNIINHYGSIRGPVARRWVQLEADPDAGTSGPRGLPWACTKAMIANHLGGNQPPARRQPVPHSSTQEFHFRRNLHFHSAHEDSIFYNPIRHRDVMSTQATQFLNPRDRGTDDSVRTRRPEPTGTPSGTTQIGSPLWVCHRPEPIGTPCGRLNNRYCAAGGMGFNRRPTRRIAQAARGGRADR